MNDHSVIIDFVACPLDRVSYYEDDYPDDFLASLDQAGAAVRCRDSLSLAEVKTDSP